MATSITNGSFEVPDVSVSQPAIEIQVFNADAKAYLPSATGWTTTDTAIEIWRYNGTGVPAYDGLQWAEINAYIAGTLSQKITPIAGDQISFAFAHRGRGSSTIKDVVRVSVVDPSNGAVVFTEDFADAKDAWGYYTRSLGIASGNPLELRFQAISSAGNDKSAGNFIDAVTFESIPSCERIRTELDAYLAKSCSQKENQLPPCKGEPKPCACSQGTHETEKECKPIDIPRIEPCISVSWGDSRCDCMETDDVEVLCITVCNCYSNATFSDFTIEYVEVVTSTGAAVPVLPDGSPSVEIVPRGPICFGDIGPCKCVSRQMVLITRGAKGGSYELRIQGICFGVNFHYHQQACFQMNLCADR